MKRRLSRVGVVGSDISVDGVSPLLLSGDFHGAPATMGEHAHAV
jgi:hypothetical protein